MTKQELSDLAGVPYDFDELDVEVALLSMPARGPRRAASLVALNALRNIEWRMAFDARGRTYVKPSGSRRLPQGMPNTPLDSPEMSACLKSQEIRPPRKVAFLRAVSSLLRNQPQVSALILAALWCGLNMGLERLLPSGNALLESLATPLGLVIFLSVSSLLLPFLLKGLAHLPAPVSTLFFSGLFFWTLLGARGGALLSLAGIFLVITYAFYLHLRAYEKSYAARKRRPEQVSSSPWHQELPSTRFGSSLENLRAASNSLRVLADRFNIELGEVSDVDRSAAVVAADAWLLAHGATHLDQAAAYGPDAVLSLGAILARAAGQGETLAPASSVAASEKEINGLREAVSDYRLWLASHLRDVNDFNEAWNRVISDLGAASSDYITSRMARSLKEHA